MNGIDIGKAVKGELEKQERTVVWLSRKLYCSRNNVYRIFEKRHIDAELLYRISIILNRDFFLIYSEALRRHEEQQ